MSNTAINVDTVDNQTIVHPWPYLSSIFEILSVGDKSARVKCLLCQPKEKVLSSALNSPSNLQKHVEVSFEFGIYIFYEASFNIINLTYSIESITMLFIMIYE